MTFNTLKILSIPKDLKDFELKEAFDTFGPSSRCFVVRNKNKPVVKTNSIRDKWNVGYVEFLCAEDAEKCLKGTRGHLRVQHEGNEVTVELKRDVEKKQKGEATATGGAEGEVNFEQRRFDRQAALKKKARLIVRNLSFQATHEDLKNHFQKYGTVVDTQIPTKPGGKRIGPAFVQFSNVAEAAKAIKKLNGSSINNRKVAVDWAVSKKEYEASKPVVVQESSTEEKLVDENESGDDNEDMKELVEGSDSDNEESNDNDLDDIEHDVEEEGDDDDDDDDKEESESDDEEEGKTKNKKNKVQPELSHGHDIDEGRTVFLRNLSFDSDQQDLRDMMEENFGKVLFARLVMDKMTEHPKGTAFVKFAEPESVKKCIEATESKEGLWLDDRQMYGCVALTKNDAETERTKKKEKEAKDSRNLHLAVEGLVRKGTRAAIGVSEADMEKRVKVETWKRNMLKDLNVFVSPVRLCVRNIPPHYTDITLKKLFLKHSSKECKITEARIMRDFKSGDNKSKGYGFVAFDKHEHAIAALRNMNNNPDVFSKNARPIIEFSLENKKAVNARVKRLEKSRENNPNFKGNKKENGSASGPAFKRKGEKDDLEEKPDFMGSLNNPKQRKLPTHVGEKIRHNRPNNNKISRKNIKKNEKDLKQKPTKRKMIENTPTDSSGGGEPAEKKKKNKKGKNKQEAKDFKEEKQFAELVNKYKTKINAANDNITKKKWFDAA